MSTPLGFQALSAGEYAIHNAPAALCQLGVSAEFHAHFWIFQLKPPDLLSKPARDTALRV
jgi:hypothetical protein